jgi:hypothetical protein
MMLKAKGPVWHQKQQKPGSVPKGLRNLDRDAPWSFSRADGWVYGHGSVCLPSHRVPVLGLFQWMPNAAHEAQRLELELGRYISRLHTICMDSKADDQGLYFRLKRDDHMPLITTPRAGMDKSPERQRMIKELSAKRPQRDRQRRSTTVEPMQGLVADLFDLERCWMHGNRNNRWLFAAMGIAVQMAQWPAYKQHRSTWSIKSEVLGI